VFHSHPEIEKIWLGLMQKECCYCIPYYPPFVADRKEWEESRGQRDGEDEDDFLRRMIGYLRMYFSVLTLLKRYQPLWQWFAVTLNAKPARLTPTFLHCALEMAGSEMKKRFGKQFDKLLR
jgi:hypothetical protein